MGKITKQEAKKSLTGKDRLLQLLARAKEKGRTLSQLLSKKNKKEDQKALLELVQENKVVELSKRYYAPGYAPNIETVADRIEKTLHSIFTTAEKPIEYKPISKAQLQKKCSNCPEILFEEALDCLIADRIIIPLRIGKIRYYLPMALFKANEKDGPPLTSIDPKKIYDAYIQLRKEQVYTNFSHVSIASLQSKTGIDLNLLHRLLLEQSKKGFAHLFEGDWALAPKEEKEAALHFQGKRFLRVKLEQPNNEPL
ncbi:hypothetical protein IT6_09340 [Methylacidiphilum caldifontis]|uniref:hypothetical protein n=1 Tax=Methylacidiphilum caldifontis TaxID=2795386 RepID=UPI001A90240B|nr:hypothetical protein [Methylacidiphilum caldifontis]QSR88554.1 hypothetical protein IT6_09340 [Methylacidiphilum caldifontis]